MEVTMVVKDDFLGNLRIKCINRRLKATYVFKISQEQLESKEIQNLIKNGFVEESKSIPIEELIKIQEEKDTSKDIKDATDMQSYDMEKQEILSADESRQREFDQKGIELQELEADNGKQVEEVKAAKKKTSKKTAKKKISKKTAKKKTSKKKTKSIKKVSDILKDTVKELDDTLIDTEDSPQDSDNIDFINIE